MVHVIWLQEALPLLLLVNVGLKAEQIGCPQESCGGICRNSAPSTSKHTRAKRSRKGSGAPARDQEVEQDQVPAAQQADVGVELERRFRC